MRNAPPGAQPRRNTNKNICKTLTKHIYCETKPSTQRINQEKICNTLAICIFSRKCSKDNIFRLMQLVMLEVSLLPHASAVKSISVAPALPKSTEKAMARRARRPPSHQAPPPGMKNTQSRSRSLGPHQEKISKTLEFAYLLAPRGIQGILSKKI